MLTNPTDRPAQPFLSFALTPVELSPGGTMQGESGYLVPPLPPHSRVTIPIDTLSDHPLSTTVFPPPDDEFALIVVSDIPIVAERAMYWLGAPGPWADGTSSLGTHSTGLRWGYAEGRVGGPLNFHTYLRIFNPTQDPSKPASVKVTFIQDDGSTIVRSYSVAALNYYPARPAPRSFINIDVNEIPELAGHAFGTLIESTNGVEITTERSMYWDSNGVFWAAGITTAGTRLP